MNIRTSITNRRPRCQLSGLQNRFWLSGKDVCCCRYSNCDSSVIQLGAWALYPPSYPGCSRCACVWDNMGQAVFIDKSSEVPPSLLFKRYRGKCSRSVKLTGYLHLVPMWWMGGTTPVRPYYVLSWRWKGQFYIDIWVFSVMKMEKFCMLFDMMPWMY